jgi:hypothetical protein
METLDKKQARKDLEELANHIRKADKYLRLAYSKIDEIYTEINNGN